MSQTFRVVETVSFVQDRPLELSQDSSRILTQVLRKQVDDRIELLDGRGSSASARIIGVKPKVQVEIESIEQHQSPNPSIELMIASLKGEKLHWVLQKVTELGVSRICIFRSEHSVALKSEAVLDKGRKILIEALRQSGNPFLPNLEFFPSLPQISWKSRSEEANVILDETSRDHFPEVLRNGTPTQIRFWIGPEGGFSKNEKLFFEQKECYLIKIAPYVLRSETAAVAAVAMCRALMGRTLS